MRFLEKYKDNNWVLLALTVVAVLVIGAIFSDSEKEVATYSDFVAAIKNGEVSEIVVAGYQVEFNERHAFFGSHEELSKLLESYLDSISVTYSYEEGNALLYILKESAFLAIMAGFMVMMYFQMRPPKTFNIIKDNSKTFNDVAGCSSAKEELRDFIGYLKEPQRYNLARPPKGIVMHGPPGNGKTLLAKALAHESGVPIISISGSDFDEIFVGIGSMRVRALFKKARKSAPCVLFIDEFDSLAAKRIECSFNRHSNDTINKFLSEMDGLGVNEGVLVVAATNRLDTLDPAAIRPGRFDRHIFIGNPSIDAREQIAGFFAKKLGGSFNPRSLAKLTAGLSGADIENIINEAAIISARSGKNTIDEDSIYSGFQRHVLGNSDASILSAEARQAIIVHEAGHALVSLLDEDHPNPTKVSVIPKGISGGVTVFEHELDETLVSRKAMESKMRVLLAGRAAEEIFLGEGKTTSGASQDIEQATQIANIYVKQLGLSSAGIECVTAGAFSPTTLERFDKEVSSLMNGALQQAKEVLSNNKSAFNKITELLEIKEVIDYEEIIALLPNQIGCEKQAGLRGV